MQRSRTKRKRKEITCFQCGCKGNKKPRCRFYKHELPRKKKNHKDTSKTHDVNNNKGKESKKANIASGIITEEILNTEDILCVANIKITDKAIVNALLVVQDYIMQTWVIDSGASFHCIRSNECFLSFSTDKWNLKITLFAIVLSFMK